MRLRRHDYARLEPGVEELRDLLAMCGFVAPVGIGEDADASHSSAPGSPRFDPVRYGTRARVGARRSLAIAGVLTAVILTMVTGLALRIFDHGSRHQPVQVHIATSTPEPEPRGQNLPHSPSGVVPLGTQRR